MQQNCSQGVGAIQGRYSLEACGCRNRTMTFVWLSKNKCPVNKGQPELIWGKIPFCGARIYFYPDWEKAEFLTTFCVHRQWVWIVIKICKPQSNTLPHSEQSCFFFFFSDHPKSGRVHISQVSVFAVQCRLLCLCEKIFLFNETEDRKQLHLEDQRMLFQDWAILCDISFFQASSMFVFQGW